MVQLRVMAIASGLCFAFHGTMIGSPPLILMQMVLLPVTAWRLYQAGNRSPLAYARTMALAPQGHRDKDFASRGLRR